MKEIGQIIKLENDGVIVTFNPSSGCAGCGLNHCCQTAGSGKREIKIHIKDHHFIQGDRVEIETPARSMLTAAFLVFILPIVISFLSYAIIENITANQIYGLIGFFISFILTELIIGIFDRLWGKNKFFEPQILRKL